MVWPWLEQHCFELTTRIRLYRGRRGLRVVRYRDEDQRAIVPAVNKSLMILAEQAAPPRLIIRTGGTLPVSYNRMAHAAPRPISN